jgi:hypothetical protein
MPHTRRTAAHNTIPACIVNCQSPLCEATPLSVGKGTEGGRAPRWKATHDVWRRNASAGSLPPLPGLLGQVQGGALPVAAPAHQIRTCTTSPDRIHTQSMPIPSPQPTRQKQPQLRISNTVFTTRTFRGVVNWALHQNVQTHFPRNTSRPSDRAVACFCTHLGEMRAVPNCCNIRSTDRSDTEMPNKCVCVYIYIYI